VGEGALEAQHAIAPGQHAREPGPGRRDEQGRRFGKMVGHTEKGRYDGLGLVHAGIPVDKSPVRYHITRPVPRSGNTRFGMVKIDCKCQGLFSPASREQERPVTILIPGLQPWRLAEWDANHRCGEHALDRGEKIRCAVVCIRAAIESSVSLRLTGPRIWKR